MNINEYFLGKFREVFTSSYPVTPTSLDGLQFPQVSKETNKMLMAIPSKAKIKECTSALHPLKALGPDGFPGIFYCHYCETVKRQVLAFIHESFRTRSISKGLNKSFIVLIPKTTHATYFNHFRPISLCNFSYKIFSKIITMRLKNLIPQLISPNQKAFAEGRWIADNTILAQEMVHKVKKFKRKGGLMLAKIDLSKAYDRLKWSFINMVMIAWGFSYLFRRMIFGRLSSVKYSLQLNGTVVGEIEPSRGLRQGDPFSPYLFIMCTEVLSRILYTNPDVHVIKFGRTMPAITHLMYADDLLLVGRENSRNGKAMWESLNKFCSWLGKIVNEEKSSILLSPNISKIQKRQIKEL